jgi:glycosyltransferase involved in cell wall biosynthesis
LNCTGRFINLLHMGKRKQLHFLLIYPLNTAPSQRFRFEQFFPSIDQKHISYTTNSFYDHKTFSSLYQRKGKISLAFRMLLCFFRRLIHMFTLSKYDCILIQRGAAPFGPPLFEWIVRFIYRKPIIYDFDDAIWRDPILNEKVSFIKKLVKSHSKVRKICKWAHTVVVGNRYLASYALQFNSNVVVIPTVVDTENKFVPASYWSNEKITIGWTGSHTTLFYLEALEPVLLQLKKRFDFSLKVIADKEPTFSALGYEFVKWSEESELKELQKIDVGIMPLPDDEWTKGKCGFKAIQYMSIGKPAVVSAVGVNGEIVDHGINGYVCKTNEEWVQYLEQLLENPGMIKSQGLAARRKIEEKYSLRMAADEWCKVLQKV